LTDPDLREEKRMMMIGAGGPDLTVIPEDEEMQCRYVPAIPVYSDRLQPLTAIYIYTLGQLSASVVTARARGKRNRQ